MAMPGTRVEGRGTVFRGLASRGLAEKGAFENLRRRSGETLPGRKSSSSKALSQGLDCQIPEIAGRMM